MLVRTLRGERWHGMQNMCYVTQSGSASCKRLEQTVHERVA